MTYKGSKYIYLLKYTRTVRTYRRGQVTPKKGLFLNALGSFFKKYYSI